MFKKILFGFAVLLVALIITAYLFRPDPTPEPLVVEPIDPHIAAKWQAVVTDDYCSEVQKLLATTTLQAENEIHLSYNSFVLSKPSVNPLISHQFINYMPVVVKGEEVDFPTIVSCKVKTPDILQKLYGAESAAEGGACSQILRRDIEAAFAALVNTDLVFDKSSIIYKDDEVVGMGPRWLSPWPYPVAEIKGDKLLLRSKALFVAMDSLMPLPERFKAAHYCHLPTQQYLYGILKGDIKNLVKPNSENDK